MADGVNRSEIRLSATGTSIVYETDALFPFMVVFKPAWMNAISLEPYTCATDAFNLPLPEEDTGAKAIRAGETLDFKWEIRLSKGEGWNE